MIPENKKPAAEKKDDEVGKPILDISKIWDEGPEKEEPDDGEDEGDDEYHPTPIDRSPVVRVPDFDPLQQERWEEEERKKREEEERNNPRGVWKM